MLGLGDVLGFGLSGCLGLLFNFGLATLSFGSVRRFVSFLSVAVLEQRMRSQVDYSAVVELLEVHLLSVLRLSCGAAASVVLSTGVAACTTVTKLFEFYLCWCQTAALRFRLLDHGLWDLPRGQPS